jgi:cytochrome c551/c552
MTRRDCIDCHAPIAEEWRQSLHHSSLTGPYWREVRELGYAKLFERSRKACVNCHAPANVLDLAEGPAAVGSSDEPLGVECTPSLLREPRGRIPAARADDVALGVDCTSCHVSTRGVVGPGRGSAAPHGSIADRRFQDPALAADTLCRACHRATVEAWKRTTLPAAGTTCIDCHMPEIRAASVAGGPERARRSHRFVGDKDRAMLESAVNASLSVATDRRARFRIVNDRVGHFFPSGGNAVSVQLRAYDAAGRVRRERVEVFGKEEALLLDFWPFNEDRRIAFGERREIVLPLPEPPGTVEAIVRYHDWMRTKLTLLTLREAY